MTLSMTRIGWTKPHQGTMTIGQTMWMFDSLEPDGLRLGAPPTMRIIGKTATVEWFSEGHNGCRASGTVESVDGDRVGIRFAEWTDDAAVLQNEAPEPEEAEAEEGYDQDEPGHVVHETIPRSESSAIRAALLRRGAPATARQLVAMADEDEQLEDELTRLAGPGLHLQTVSKVLSCVDGMHHGLNSDRCMCWWSTPFAEPAEDVHRLAVEILAGTGPITTHKMLGLILDDDCYSEALRFAMRASADEWPPNSASFTMLVRAASQLPGSAIEPRGMRRGRERVYGLTEEARSGLE